MRRISLVLLALLFAPATAGCAAAQSPQAPAAVSDARPPAPATQSRRPKVYTGLALSFSASAGSDMVITPAYPVVRAVEADSPGQKAGIMAGDVITEVNGQDSREQGALWLEPGVRYTLRIRTGEQEREVLLTPLPPRDPPPAPAP